MIVQNGINRADLDRLLKEVISVPGLLRSLVPAKPVLHSSGKLILSSTTGYLPNTLGSVAKGVAVAGSPVAIAIGGILAAAAAGIFICRRMNRRDET